MLLCALMLFASCFEDCQPPFPPISQIDKFRVLAIKSEPPELAPGETAQLSFLAMNPDGAFKAGTFSCDKPQALWVACLPMLGPGNSNASCTGLASGGFDGGAPDGGVPDGGNPFGSVTLCPASMDANRTESLVCLPGFPPCGETIRWTVPKGFLDPLKTTEEKEKGADALLILTASYDGLQQISLKNVLISSKTEENRNHNPKITGFLADEKSITSCMPGEADKCDEITVPIGGKLKIKAEIDPASQDELTSTVDGVKFKEDIQILWYATEGEFDRSASIFSGKNPPQHTEDPYWYPNDFRGQALKEGLQVNIVAIARDRRGGFDWRMIRVKVGPKASP
tara:strand:- start:1815 stop:2834 length:1020 start_codon:yes stop_codon:yes gene_type:complete